MKRGADEARGRPSAHDDDLGADVDAVVEVGHVVVGHADAARGDGLSDGVGLVRAVDAILRSADIDGARAERVANAAYHVSRKVRPAAKHRRRRRPIGPFAFVGDAVDPAPFEAGAPDADSIAQRLAVAENVVKPPLPGGDDDRSGEFWAVIGDDLARDRRGEGPPLALARLLQEKIEDEGSRRRRGGQGEAGEDQKFRRMGEEGRAGRHVRS